MSITTSLEFCGVLSESKRIINAHSRHFLVLSLLFLLPLSFSVIVYPTLQHTLTQPDLNPPQSLLRSTPDTHRFATVTLTITLIYILLALFLSLSAAGTITYSVFHGFYGRPVKIISSIKSLFTSFLPLFVTVISSQIVTLAITGAFAILAFLVIKGIEIIGFRISFPTTPYSIAVGSLVLVLVLVYLQMSWAVVYAVVVVESRWGFGALKRSASLVRGMRRVSLSLLLFFGVFTGLLVWSSSASAVALGGARDGWKSWAFVVQIVVTSSLLTLLMLHSIAASTVLYMYCKATHGELAGEIVEEFAREYVSLPFDEEKLPHVVYVVRT